MVILEVYEYYDEPLLYLAQDGEKHLLLAMLAEVPERAKQRWLYAPVSESSLADLKQGKMKLYEAFRSPPDGKVLSITTIQGAIVDSRWIDSSTLSDTILPDPDVNLED